MTNPSLPVTDFTCHFLRLAPELRKLVYDFVLSEPDGLFNRYEEGETGTKAFQMYVPLTSAIDNTAAHAN
jgi:hypothetical protein